MAYITAKTNSTTPTTPTERLNDALLAMHGPTRCLGTTISPLVPFPAAIEAPADAKVTDLSIRLTPDRTRNRMNTSIRVRLSTAMSCGETLGFYRCQFSDLGLATSTTADTPGCRISTILSDDELTHYAVRMAGSPMGSVATIEVTSETTDPPTGLDLTAWHGWKLPTDAAQLECTEVFTIATGPHSHPRAVYDSHYTLSGVARHELRVMLDNHIRTQGWHYIETYEDILELREPFDAEICVDGDDAASALSILGEFDLRAANASL